MVSLYHWSFLQLLLTNKIILALYFLSWHRLPKVIDIWDHVQIHILRKVLGLSVCVRVPGAVLSFNISCEVYLFVFWVDELFEVNLFALD